MMLHHLFVMALFISGWLGKHHPTQKQDTAQLQMVIENVVDGKPLQLDTVYHNHFGEDFSIHQLKYYISNVQLLQGDKVISIPDSYFLVNEAERSSKIVQMPMPAGTYSGISFCIGIDSLHNVSGAQTGVLDPMEGMFWTWNSGYIMAKLEGASPLSHLPNNRIEYHIGGYKAPYNTLRRIMILFKKINLTVGAHKILQVQLSAEVQKWFDGMHFIKIKDNASIMTPGSAASEVADNYSTLFTLLSAAVI